MHDGFGGGGGGYFTRFPCKAPVRPVETVVAWAEAVVWSLETVVAEAGMAAALAEAVVCVTETVMKKVLPA
ncbi:MAG: hypothetical protein OXU94_00280 [Gammaproteobacteria bacterium]|nr:hypothetical protein [Gammaproteobacteria bacterium]